MENNERRLEDLVEGIDFVYVPCVDGRLKVDAKEHDPVYRDIIEKAWRQADKELVSWWLWHIDLARLQKKILKERYGITWRSIYELNPEVTFD